MDFLKAEINKKRKLIEELNETKKSKYLTQRDILELKNNELLKKQNELNLKKKHHVEPEIDTISFENTKSINDENQQCNQILTALSKLSVDVIKRKLRLLQQPITLFGESDNDRLQRLALLKESNAEIDEEDEFRLNASSGHNLPNSFLQQRDSILNHSHHRKNDDDDDEDDDDDHPTKSTNDLSSTLESNHNVKIYSAITNFSKDKNLSKEKVIYKYFRNLLKVWEYDLNQRDEYEKSTAKGKMETKTLKQCKDYIRPLFKLCKKKEVNYDILDRLYDIVQWCEDGNFMKASEEYLKCAIGNAAWPIGLTMVGIHERSGRERISTNKVAHVMNNELQRKYLSSVKRLMTFAQTKRPDVPPSMKMLC